MNTCCGVGCTSRMLQQLLLYTVVVMCLIPSSPASQLSCKSALENLALKDKEALALMVDATGKSIDDLGKWDQCRDLGEDVAHYCSIRFALNVSIPTALNNSELKYIVEGLYASYQKFVHYQELEGQYEFNCPADTPSIAGSPGGIIMVIITFFLAILVVFGTILDGFDSNWWPEIVVETPGIVAPVGGIQDSAEIQPLIHQQQQIHHHHSRRVGERRSKGLEFLVAFSAVRNFRSLIGPSPPALAFLNGMRAISITWVILGHSLDYLNKAGVLNFAHVITKDVQHPASQVFPAAEFSVDSFFWLSGFLVTYLTVQELQKKNRVNWFLYYFHRVWRLSPAYFYALFFYMCVSIYVSDGPMWPRYMEMVDSTCGKYWWTNVLYINNFIPAVWNNQCFLWDIVAPVVFVIYHKSKAVGWTVVVVGVVLTTVVNGVLAHVHHFVWNATDPSEYMAMIYGKPYTRAAPWLLGIACGFLYLEKRQLSRAVVYVGWAISATVMMLCVYGPARQFQGGRTELQPIVNTWGSGSNVMYFTFAKLGWSLALSFLMYTMAMGWGGFVRRFLGAPLWNPLARLTYSTYLFHPIIMFIVYYSHLQYFSYDAYYISVLFVGITFLSFCTAAVMFLLLERPMTNMEKLFLPTKKH